MRRLGRWLASITLAAVFLIGLLALLLVTVSGLKLAVVYSGSMEPVMPVGSLGVMESVEPSQIKAGDIIAFNPIFDPDTIVSHRVIEVLDEESTLALRTKGDANEDPDIFSVPAGRVLGRVIFNIPHLGFGLVKAKDYVRSELGFAFLICLPTLWLIGIAAKDLKCMFSPRGRRLRRLKERRRRREKSRRTSLATV